MSLLCLMELNMRLLFSVLTLFWPLIPPTFNVLNLIVEILSFFTPLVLQVVSSGLYFLSYRVLVEFYTILAAKKNDVRIACSFSDRIEIINKFCQWIINRKIWDYCCWELTKGQRWLHSSHLSPRLWSSWWSWRPLLLWSCTKRGSHFHELGLHNVGLGVGTVYCCASTLSSCLRGCLPHLTMVLLWIKEYQVNYRPECCPKSGSPGGPPLFSITVAAVLTASAVLLHYLYVNLLEYFLPGKGVFKAQCCCYDLIWLGHCFYHYPWASSLEAALVTGGDCKIRF